MKSWNFGWTGRKSVLMALGVALLALAGCATAEPPAREEDTSGLVWPLPPEQPRIRYVRSISTREDIGAKDKISIAASLVGDDGKKPVEQMMKPYAVHADSDGRVFVADTGWGKLLVFDAAKKKFQIWGQDGPGMLVQPLGVTSDSLGRIFVTDGKQQRVVVYDRDGKFLFAAGLTGEMERPVGVVVNESLGRIYVADTGAHDIAVFDMTGKLISRLGSRGVEPGQFNFPTNLAIGPDGKLYVVDSMNFRIQILDADGNSLAIIGSHGDRPGNFARPKGVAIDSDGHIYVTDAAFNNIQIFDSSGMLLLFIGTLGQGPGQFWLPAGAYIDPGNRIYLADQYNHRVQILQYLGDSAPQPDAAESVPAEPPPQ